jgi:hypothetical protein
MTSFGFGPKGNAVTDEMILHQFQKERSVIPRRRDSWPAPLLSEETRLAAGIFRQSIPLSILLSTLLACGPLATPL